MPLAAFLQRGWWPVLLLLVIVTPVQGQYLAGASEILYRAESAPREFYDGFTASMDVTVHPSRDLWQTGLQAPSQTLALIFSLEYALSSQLSAGLLAEALGSAGTRQPGLQWLFLKYTYHYERNDYALRVAVDPVSESVAGFPQVDVAFLVRAAQGPSVVTDFAFGIRRVRRGFAGLLEQDPQLEGPSFIQVFGKELTVLLRYNLLLSPSGSRVFLGMRMESGTYTEVHIWPAQSNRRMAREAGAFRLLTGISLERPAFLVSPFLTLPLLTWSEGNAQTRLGIRLTVR